MKRNEIQYCATCQGLGKLGNCAPLRCYCGHPACPSYRNGWRPAK